MITEEKTKELLTEILVEMLQEKRELFYDIILEAMEDIGLSKAMMEGRENDFVDETEVLCILNSQDQWNLIFKVSLSIYFYLVVVSKKLNKESKPC